MVPPFSLLFCLLIRSLLSLELLRTCPTSHGPTKSLELWPRKLFIDHQHQPCFQLCCYLAFPKAVFVFVWLYYLQFWKVVINDSYLSPYLGEGADAVQAFLRKRTRSGGGGGIYMTEKQSSGRQKHVWYSDVFEIEFLYWLNFLEMCRGE